MLVTTPTVRQGDVAELGDFPGDVKAHFQDRALVPVAQAQERQGKADFVVLVAGVFQGAVALAEHLSRSVLWWSICPRCR